MPETRAQRWRRRALNEVVHRGWERIQARGAIAPGTARADRFGSFGRGSLVAFPPATIYGEAHVHLGEDTLVGAGATLSAGYAPGQEDLPARALVLGDRCLVNVRCSLVAHESIEVGDDVWFGQQVYVTDANHGFDDLDLPIGRQLGAHLPVHIGSGSWLGHGAVVLPGTRIGRNCVVAAGSVVRGEIPDHAVVGGVPAKVLRRLDEADAGTLLDSLDRTIEPLAAGLGGWPVASAHHRRRALRR